MVKSIKKRLGATAKEWNTWAKLAPKDLLPVVCNQNSPISKYSSMKSIGKTPSKYNDFGEVIGIGKWTKLETHPTQIDSWKNEPSYGICVQTRYVRAIDIDVDDVGKAADIRAEIDSVLAEENIKLPIRERENSGKCLMFFKMKGEHGKQVIKLKEPEAAGAPEAIEFLMNGQQFVAAGTHTSGVRYKIDWRDNDAIPELTEKQYNDIVFILNEQFGVGLIKKRYRGERVSSEKFELDHNAKFLVENNLVIGQDPEDGKIFIDCPWEHYHSTTGDEVTDTCYFLAGTGGYEQGHFHCFHNSCADKTNGDFEEFLRIVEAEFDDITLPNEKPSIKLSDLKLEIDKHGRPYATLPNLRKILSEADVCGYEIAFNEYLGETVLFNVNTKTWERETDEIFIELRGYLEQQYRFKEISRDKMRDAAALVAKRNKMDSMINWLNDLEWDGIERIPNFMADYMGTEDTLYTRAVSVYLWTALAARSLEPGHKCDMVPVLISPEGRGKSTAVKALAPTPEQFVEIDMSDNDDANARKMRGKSVGEISELRGLRTRASEAILAFITRSHEEWTPKYKEFVTRFPRRLVMVATTNEIEFLDGVRVHRRWLPIEMLNRAISDKIREDNNQLWAEARELFKKNGLMYQEAETLAKEERGKHRVRDVWEEKIQTWLDTADTFEGDNDEGKTPSQRKNGITLNDVLTQALNISSSQLHRGHQMRVAECLKALGWEQIGREEINGRSARVWKKKPT